MQFKVSEEGIRLDLFLSQNVSNLSRSQITKIIKQGKVFVNNIPVKKAGYSLKSNDQIFFPDHLEIDSSHIIPQQIPVKILYEDEFIVAVDKPSGMVVHPGAGNKDSTLLNAILFYLNSAADKKLKEKTGIIHRLDKETSGVILVAKNLRSQLAFQELFQKRDISKTYIAIVNGYLKENSGHIETFYGRDRRNRLKFTGKVKDGKVAITIWKKLYEANLATVVEVNIKTGRTHQIRVHFSEMGHPVLNDNLYGKPLPKPSNKKYFEEYAVLKRIKRLCLHAHNISFVHPFTRREISITSPVPHDMEEVINFLKKIELIL